MVRQLEVGDIIRLTGKVLRILQIVEQLMQTHIKELKDLGVDLAAQAKDAVKKMKGKKPIEDVL